MDRHGYRATDRATERLEISESRAPRPDPRHTGAVTLDFDALRRRPDFEAPELRAWDAADTLILDSAPWGEPTASDVVVIGDGYGALTLGALDRGALHHGACSAERRTRHT